MKKTLLGIFFLVLPLMINAGTYMEHADGSKATSSSFQSANTYPDDTQENFGTTPTTNGVSFKWNTNTTNDEYLQIMFAESDGQSLPGFVISDDDLSGTSYFNNLTDPFIGFSDDAGNVHGYMAHDTTSFYWKQNNTIALTITETTATVPGKILSTATNDIGWTTVDGADNTACNSICTAGCVEGWNVVAGNVTGLPLNCDDATADVCRCAGSS